MKKGIIIYRSKYGSTKKYVDWLQELIEFDVVEVSTAKINKVKEYDMVILCGAIYATGISGLPFIRKNINILKNKKIAIFCVGASPYEEEAFNQLKEHNLKEDLKNIPVFYGRGAWNEDKMTVKDRTLCKLLQKAIGKKDPSTYEPWMKALMMAVGKKCDWTDKEFLEPLMKWIKEN